MDFPTHAKAFRQGWVIRYMHPAESSWKQLIDSFILYDKKENLIYPEERMAVIGRLSAFQKTRMLKSLPKEATYMKACFKEFWALGLRPTWDNRWEGIESESPWIGHRVKIDAAPHVIRIAKNRLDVVFMSDFVNNDTDKFFTRQEWIDIIIKEET